MSLMHGRPSSVASRTSVTIVWSIAREAVRRGSPDLGLPAARGRSRDAQLCVSIADDACAAELVDPTSGSRHRLELGPVRIETVTADGFTHIDVTEGGVPMLAATTRSADSGERLLYAKTTLLSRLGVRGGRYGRPTL